MSKGVGETRKESKNRQEEKEKKYGEERKEERLRRKNRESEKEAVCLNLFL
jgi:hypothetical protein